MKVCVGCKRAVPNEEEQCPDCDGEDFEPLLVACYDDIEPYFKEEDNATQ